MDDFVLSDTKTDEIYLMYHSRMLWAWWTLHLEVAGLIPASIFLSDLKLAVRIYAESKLTHIEIN